MRSHKINEKKQKQNEKQEEKQHTLEDAPTGVETPVRLAVGRLTPSLVPLSGVKRPEWYPFWRLTPKMLPFWALNAQPGTLAGV